MPVPTVYLPYAQPAFGTLLQLGQLNTSPETYTSIANIGDLSGPDLTIEDADVTSHTQGFPWHVFVPCLIMPGQITFPLFFIPYNIVGDSGGGSPGGLIDVAVGRQMRNWRVQFPDQDLSAWYFTAFISKYSMKAPVKGVLTMETTLKLSGQVYFTGDANVPPGLL
jgi:hypothetical protein